MSVSRVETLSTTIGSAYRGTFAVDDDAPVDGLALPPGWEGLYFPFAAPLADLRPDGTPARDGVLPEIDLPRRMYAGEDTIFHRPLRFGDRVQQRTAAGSVVEKTGKAGRLVFADIVREYRTVGHADAGVTAIDSGGVSGPPALESTWHDVFLPAADPAALADRPPPPRAPEPPGGFDWTEELAPNALQLFRFSALTFNTHRIHYDRAWATDVEGLDDLLVHGPLTRILLLDAARRHAPDAAIGEFSFRATSPIFVDRTFTIAGRRGGAQTELRAIDAAGELLATGRVTHTATATTD